MVDRELKQSPTVNPVENIETLISPRFKSLAAMAGWDEESILIASLIVEDTPDRESKHKKRSVLNLKTPPSNPSTRKRRNQKKISIPVLDLDEEEEDEKPETQEHQKTKTDVVKECKRDEYELISKEASAGVSCSKSVVPCIDKLKEELSCAICLEICFEPSTTSCGHSFCKKCLRSAADKCGRRCPKCRELISNGRSCTVNTVLWNTIQLLFPEEVEARKAAGGSSSSNSQEDPSRRRIQLLESRQGGPRRKRPATLADIGIEYSPPPPPPPRNTRREVEELGRLLNGRNGRGTSRQSEEEVEGCMQRENLSWVLERGGDGRERRRRQPSQDEDAALALRLQREEFLGAFRGNDESLGTSSSLSLARANLRAMASRANYNVRNRNRPSFS